jgi:hypothetical protein
VTIRARQARIGALERPLNPKLTSITCGNRGRADCGAKTSARANYATKAATCGSPYEAILQRRKARLIRTPNTAEVRGNPPMVEGSDAVDNLPEGLQRERKGPYDKNLGRNQDATQIPKNWTGEK